MNCYHCGAEIPYKAGRCPECGITLEKIRKLELKGKEKDERKSNPFRWTVRDSFTLLAFSVISGVVFYNIDKAGVFGFIIGLIIGSFFGFGFYTQSLRYVIWPDLRVLAFDKPLEKVSIINRFVGWFSSRAGAYQRMAGYLTVITGIGALIFLSLAQEYEKLPEVLLNILGITIAISGLIAIDRITSSWEQPPERFKGFYELIAIFVIILVNVVLMVLSPHTYNELEPLWYTLSLFGGGIFISLFIYGMKIKRLIKDKGYQTPSFYV